MNISLVDEGLQTVTAIIAERFLVCPGKVSVPGKELHLFQVKFTTQGLWLRRLTLLWMMNVLLI